MQRGFQTKLKLNNQQKSKMARHAGYSRWIWNWGLRMWTETYQAGLKPTASKLRKFYTNHVKPQYPWQSQLSSRVYQFAFLNLAIAFERFFKGIAKYPVFKKKGVNDSFTLDSGGKVMNFSGKRLKLPVIGWVRTFEVVPNINTKRITISREADEWFISISYEFEPESSTKSKMVIGVDVGIKQLATCSDSTVFANPKAYKQAQKKLARLQRSLSRKQPGSNNRHKARIKVAKVHQRIKNIRKDAIHKLTSWLCKNHAEVVIEDLNVSGMMNNHKLAGALADASLSEIRRQVEYKASWYGTKVTYVDQWYPSSKTCSSCGNKQEMPLNVRVFHCCACGMVKDRDLNAAINLEQMAEGSTVKSLSDRVLPTVRSDAGNKHQYDSLSRVV